MTLIVAAAAVGSSLGALLGALGHQLGVAPPFTFMGGLVFALVLLELVVGPLPFPEINRETPARWINHGPVVWGILNGGALGAGFLSRIGFWSWYAIPVGAVLISSPTLGALVYGAYSVTRAGGSMALAAPISRRLRFVKLEPMDLLTRRHVARVATTVAATIFAAAMLTAGL